MKLKINIIALLLVQICFSQSKLNNFYAGIKFGNNSLVDLNKILGAEKYNDQLINYGSDTYNKPVASEPRQEQSNYGFFVGYKLTDNISFELGVSRFKDIAMHDEELYHKFWVYLSDFQNKYSEREFSMLQIKPTLVISGSYKKINPYSKFALVIGKDLKYDYSRILFNPLPEYSGLLPSYLNYQRSGGTPVGFDGAVGVEFKILKNIQLFTELEFFTMKYSAKYGYYEEYRSGVSYTGIYNYHYSIWTSFFDFENMSPESNQALINLLEYTDRSEVAKNSILINNTNLNIGVKYNF